MDNISPVVKLIAAIIIVTAILWIAGAIAFNYAKSNSIDESVFVIIDTQKLDKDTLYIVYHKETKVMYVVDNGVFSILVNPDNTPILYEENINE